MAVFRIIGAPGFPSSPHSQATLAALNSLSSLLPTLYRLIMPNTPTLLDSAELAPVDYKFEVKTTDRFKSGTSARVFFNLFGVQGSTGRCVEGRGREVGLAGR